MLLPLLLTNDGTSSLVASSANELLSSPVEKKNRRRDPAIAAILLGWVAFSNGAVAALLLAPGAAADAGPHRNDNTLCPERDRSISLIGSWKKACCGAKSNAMAITNRAIYVSKRNEEGAVHIRILFGCRTNKRGRRSGRQNPIRT